MSPTDSPWPISSNPDARYNDPKRKDCNLLLPLWPLVPASTAVPIYFPPEIVKIGRQTFAFVDGGVTAYNNPAFLLYHMATHPAYQLEWMSRMVFPKTGRPPPGSGYDQLGKLRRRE